jgi:hypothetical protein
LIPEVYQAIRLRSGFRSTTAALTRSSKGTLTLGIELFQHIMRRTEQMKLATLVVVSALAVSSTLALAQGGAPSGRGAVTGDPAASSATPGSAPTTGSAMKPNPSGSGTSTSGGKDDNGDQGRDRMPESNKAVKPNNPGKM